jgi:hypothetical protein
MGAFIAAVALIFYARSKVTDLIQDERDIKITEQAMTRTMQVFRVVLCIFSIGAVAQMLQVPSSPRPPPSQYTVILFSPRVMGFFAAWISLPDDLPVHRVQIILRPEMRGMGYG